MELTEINVADLDGKCVTATGIYEDCNGHRRIIAFDKTGDTSYVFTKCKTKKQFMYRVIAGYFVKIEINRR